LRTAPNILYKYRTWCNDWDKRALSHNEIYYASFEQFNDPFDGTIPFRYKEEQLTEENIFKKYYLVTEEMEPDWTQEQIHAYSLEYQKLGLLKNESHLANFDSDLRKELADSIGIISLARVSDNFLMWSHYSDMHKGYCIGYNTSWLVKQACGAIFPVNYDQSIPRIDMFEGFEGIVNKLIYTKSNVWCYEDEIRIHKTGFAHKTISLVPETFAEIIFGCKMEQKTKFTLLDKCAEKFPDAKVYEMKLHKDEFKLEPFRLR
jgi:hypothetical protein